MFTRTAGAWIQQVKMLASDGDSWDHFGNSVDVDGDIAVIGAPGNGSAYVFRFVPAGDVPALGPTGGALLALVALALGARLVRRRSVR